MRERNIVEISDGISTLVAELRIGIDSLGASHADLLAAAKESLREMLGHDRTVSKRDTIDLLRAAIAKAEEQAL